LIVFVYLFSGIDPIPLKGHLTLNSTAACIHRRPNFYAAIVGMGKNRRGLEIYGIINIFLTKSFQITSFSLFRLVIRLK
jgi:hypothetical protein